MLKTIIHLIVAININIFMGFCSNVIAAQYFPSTLNIPCRDRDAFVNFYASILQSVKEPPLWLKARNNTMVSYRLIFVPPKRGEPLIFRLERVKGIWTLYTKHSNAHTCGTGKICFCTQVVSMKEINELKRLFDKLSFWSLPTVGALEAEYYLMDSSLYMLEAVENGRYHLIQRGDPANSDKNWISHPQALVEFDNLRRTEGYPYIDRATNVKTNNDLVEVADYFLILSGLKPK